MWNVVGPSEVGSPADLEVGSEVVRSQNHRCHHLAEEDSEVQIAATVEDSVVAEEEEGMADEVEASVEVEAVFVVDVMTMGVVDVAAGTAVADSVAAGVEALDTKVEGVSVSTQTVDLGDHRMVLVGMVLRAVGSEVVVMEAVEADSVHRGVVVGMEVGTVPISNGRAQGWTRIAIQSDQGIEHIFSGVPPGSTVA